MHEFGAERLYIPLAVILFLFLATPQLRHWGKFNGIRGITVSHLL
jgi:hypothetical protein